MAAARLRGSTTLAPVANDEAIGAIVLFRTAAGHRPNAGELTADHIEALLPPADVVDRVAAFFSSSGFDVGRPVGLSMSIVAPPSTYEATFGVGPRPPGEEYPLDRLPHEIRDVVAAVTAPAPIDFGPGSYP